MYVFLLLLSAITMATGLFAVGFGLAPYEGSLGNALVMAGSVGVVGGMILFGLAAAVRQLRRIADAVGPQTAPVRGPAAADSAGLPARAHPAAEGWQARPDARPGEGPAEASDGAAERPRPAAARSEPPMVEEHEAVPLAPQRAPAVPVSRGAPPRAEPDARPTPADIMARLSNLAAATPRSLARPELQRATAPALERPAAEGRPRQNPNMFDALWASDQRAPRQSHPEAIARAPEGGPELKTDMRAEPKLEVRPEPKQEPHTELPQGRERLTPASRARAELPTTPPGSGTRPIAILKSGVIDGMAYTLYTDGSIEAELPQGTMRFGSIDELRTHLEKAERQD